MESKFNNFDAISCEELAKADLNEINGGSEVSDAFWGGLGIIVGRVKNAVTKFIATDHGGAGVIAL